MCKRIEVRIQQREICQLSRTVLIINSSSLALQPTVSLGLLVLSASINSCFNYLVGLLGPLGRGGGNGGELCRMGSFYTGKHNTEIMGHTFMSRVEFKPSIPVFGK